LIHADKTPTQMCCLPKLTVVMGRRVASLVRDHFIEGVAQGEGDADWSALALLAPRRAGLG
jgi:hypothetical protein